MAHVLGYGWEQIPGMMCFIAAPPGAAAPLPGSPDLETQDDPGNRTAYAA